MRVHTDSGIKFIEIFVFVVVEFSLHLSHFATYLELSAQGNGDKIYSSEVYQQLVAGQEKSWGSFASDKSQSGIGLDGAVRSTSDNSDGVADSVL